MATGDATDMQGRIRALLPRGWFADTTPVLDAVLAGIGSMLAYVYALLGYVQQQTRIATATEVWLDLISFDFFGSRLPRRTGETDAAYRARIQLEMLKPRNTRAAVIEALEELTGQTPLVFEPANAGDTGGYTVGGVGYCMAGGYGSLALPFQAFISAYRGSSAQGVPFASGYGDPEGEYDTPGGYGGGSLVYGSLSMVSGLVVDADIYAAVAGVMPVSTIAWMNISNGPQGRFDLDMRLNYSDLS